jgi:hypothetical protein
MNPKDLSSPRTSQFGLRDLMTLTTTVAFACLAFLDPPTLHTLIFLIATLVCIGIGAALRTGAYGAILFAILGGIVGFVICETLFGGPFPCRPSQSTSNWFILCGGAFGAYYRSIDIFRQKEIG